MNDWHKWAERKPTEADARNHYIEFCDVRTGQRWMELAGYIPVSPKTTIWRTPTPLPGEESGKGCGCREAICQHTKVEQLPRKELVKFYKARIHELTEERDALALKESGPAVADSRTCTCHPDDRPTVCSRKFALSDCAAGSDAVRVLEALIAAIQPTLRGSRSVTFYTLLTALAAVRAQEDVP